MSTAGVLIGLLITGQTFSIVMTGVGVIALAGIVVNNNIILIDTFDFLKKRNAFNQRSYNKNRGSKIKTSTAHYFYNCIGFTTYGNND